MFDYRGHYVNLDEATSFFVNEYKVSSFNNSRMIFKASSVAGVVYSTNAQEAVFLAKQQLDQYLAS